MDLSHTVTTHWTEQTSAAHFDYLDEEDPRRRGTENPARDIANSAYEDVIGARPARHRKESTDE